MRKFFLLCLAALASLSMSAVPAQAQGTYEIVAWQNIRINCLNMNGMVQVLNGVNNEMQVYNNDRATWQSRGSCTSVMQREVAVRDFMGWYDTGKFFVGIEMVRYQDVPDPPNKKPCKFLCVKITDAKGMVGFRPIYIVRKAHATFAPECFRARVTRSGVTLFGNYGRGPLPACVPNAGYDAYGRAAG